MTMSQPDPATLIVEFLAAFAAANPRKVQPRVWFERGWYWFDTRQKYRRGELEVMRDRLLARAGDLPWTR
jgi:hypothetical protein